MNVLTFLDLNGNEVRNMRLQNLAVAPVGATQGFVYFNTILNTVMMMTGTGWIDIGGVIRTVEVATGNPISVSIVGNKVTLGVGEASLALRGTMSASDKQKLDGATASNAANTLMSRDGLGNVAVGKLTARVVSGLDAPVNPTDAATKGYVDMAIQGLDAKVNVRLMSDVNVAIVGTSLIDGVQSVVGDRVLLIGQTDPKQNGLWVVQTGNWTRPLDFAAGAGAKSGYAFIQEGLKFKDCGYVCVSDKGTDTIDVHGLTWAQFSSAGQITFGKGGIRTGNILDIVSANAGVRINEDNIQLMIDESIFAIDAVKGLLLRDKSIVLAKLGNDIFANSITQPADGKPYEVRNYTPLASASVARKYVTTATIGGGTTVTIAHPFATQDIGLHIYKNTGERIYVDETITATTILLNASGAIQTVKVVMIG